VRPLISPFLDDRGMLWRLGMSDRTELLAAYLRTLPNKVLYQDDDLSLNCTPFRSS